MGCIECVCCKKLQCDIVARTFALIAPVHTVSNRVSCSSETIPNAPKHHATHQNMSLGPMGLIGCVRCKKSRRNFVAQTFALIAPVHPVLQWVSWNYKTIPNAPKHHTTHRNMSLGSNGADWLRSLRKIPMWLHGTNFCINCTAHPVLHRVSCSYEMIPNAHKHYATHQNMSLGYNGVD